MTGQETSSVITAPSRSRRHRTMSQQDSADTGQRCNQGEAPKKKGFRPRVYLYPSRRRTHSFTRDTTRAFSTPNQGTNFETQPTRRTFADDPFRARFGHRLPRGLREQAHGMAWRTFTETFCAPGGALSLQSLNHEQLRAGRRRYTITLADSTQPSSQRTTTHTITSMGAISAMTHILADGGRRVEILEFHQFTIFEATVTMIYAAQDRRKVWTVGFGSNPDISAANSLVNAANRLYPTVK